HLAALFPLCTVYPKAPFQHVKSAPNRDVFLHGLGFTYFGASICDIGSRVVFRKWSFLVYFFQCWAYRGRLFGPAVQPHRGE
ncbi:MAG: hypothetical protein P8046_14375, partial [Anaerolineales bacterium]